MNIFQVSNRIISPTNTETSQAENADSKIADVLNLKLLKLFPGFVF